MAEFDDSQRMIKSVRKLKIEGGSWQFLIKKKVSFVCGYTKSCSFF